MKNRIRKAPDQRREVPDDPNLIFESQEIIIFMIFKPTQIHQEVPENNLRQPKIHQSVSLQRSPRSEGNVLVCVWKVMVRSTLLHLPPRGALRAFLGGPLVMGLDDGFSIFVMVQSGSNNKSFRLHLGSKHKKKVSQEDPQKIARRDPLGGI